MTDKNRQITLARRPHGVPEASDFEMVEADAPEPTDGQLLVRTNYLSVDPYMRGLIGGVSAPYADSVDPGEMMIGGTVGTVASSRDERFGEGDVVEGFWGWQEMAAVDADRVRRVDRSLAPISTALGVLGLTGLTAYFGLLEVGRPAPGNSVFVSGAAGAVGSVVCQIARIKGCRVAGSAGSQTKIDFLLDECAADAAFNYKEQESYRKALRRACPDGVDVYFDNVGGPLTDEVFRQINHHARIALCGQISQYNNSEAPDGPRVLWRLVPKESRVEGFLVFSFEDRYDEARRQLAEWIDGGELVYRETIVDGIENAPKAFIGLFHGENIGKQIVRVAPES